MPLVSCPLQLTNNCGELPLLRSIQVIDNAMIIGEQHVDLSVNRMKVVNDPYPAALPAGTAAATPAKLAATCSALNHATGVRAL